MEQRRFINRVYLQSLLSVSLAVLLIQACGCANNICVGKLLGSDGLAVMSIVNPVSFVFATVGSLFGVGGSIHAARCIGTGDRAGADRSLFLSVSVMALLSLFFTAGIWIFTDPLMALLRVPEGIFTETKNYLLCYAPAAFAAMGVYIPFNFLKIKGAQRYGVYLNGILFCVNIGLDLLFVKVFSMGMAGIGLATTLGYWACTGLGLFFLYSGKAGYRIPEKKPLVRDFTRCLTLGSPSGVNNLCHLFRSYFLNLLILSSLGKTGLSAFSILSTVFLFSVTVTNGTSLCMASFAAVFFPEKDNKSLRQLFAVALFSAGVLMGIYVLLVELFPGDICRLFGATDPEVRKAGISALRIYAISLLFSAVNTLLSTYYQAIGQAVLSNVLTVLRSFALVIPGASLSIRLWGNDCLWLGFLWAEVLTTGLTLLFSFLLSRMKKRSFLLLLDTEVEKSGRYLAFSVDADNTHAVAHAQRVTGFCEANDLSSRLTMAIGLSVEEILVSFNDHALAGQNPSLRTNVRILIYDESVVLRFRTAGKPFDPVKYAETDPELAGDSMGIRMVQKLSRSVLYDRVFGVNNLTIIF